MSMCRFQPLEVTERACLLCSLQSFLYTCEARLLESVVIERNILLDVNNMKGIYAKFQKVIITSENFSIKVGLYCIKIPKVSNPH